jgi:hypothetical protein
VNVLRVLLASFGVIALVGCGATMPTSSVSGPTPTSAITIVPSPTPTSLASLGVVVIEPAVWAAPRATYFVAIIGLDGKIRASVRAFTPTALCCYPLVSVAGSHVYFLDGDTKLMRLDIDGSTTQVASLPGSHADRVVVAIRTRGASHSAWLTSGRTPALAHRRSRALRRSPPSCGWRPLMARARANCPSIGFQLLGMQVE